MHKPVYIFSGFLDSGKTTEIKRALKDPNFTTTESTLILCFEQGDNEYEPEFLKQTNCQIEYLDKIEDLTQEKQNELENKYNADRVFIEMNGMQDDNVLHKNGLIWDVAQILTTIDCQTFNMYMQNMRQFMYNHVFYADIVLLNKCDNMDKRYLRNNLKSINQNVMLIYIDSQGNETDQIEDELFDLSKDLTIEDIDYGLWYMDALDNPMKYNNKTITIKVKYVEEFSNALIMGRKAMVCCNNDTRDIAIPCFNIDAKKIDKNSYYFVTGKIHAFKDNYGQDSCYLKVSDYKQAEAPKDEFVTFS